MNRRIIFVFLLIIVIVEAVYLWTSVFGVSREDRMQKAGEKVITLCAKEAHKPSCYDRELPKLMKKFSFEEVFAITKIVQKQDASYAYCHVLGHALSAAETKKDPSKWQEVITRCPSGVCSNGCVHGAFQERFRSDVLTDNQIAEVSPDLRTVCEPRAGWSPTGMEQATCYHALGHLLMYITGADIRKSTALCDELIVPTETNNHRVVCYDGVFMQIYQPLEPEDKALIVGKEQTRQSVGTFCDNFSEQRQASCVNESWPLYFEEIQRPSYASIFCGQLSKDFSGRCYTGLFYILMVQFRFNMDVMENYCNGLPALLVDKCFASAASRLIETDWDNADRALAWCARSTSVDVQNACFAELSTSAAFTLPQGSAPRRAICEGMPSGLRDRCKI